MSRLRKFATLLPNGEWEWREEEIDLEFLQWFVDGRIQLVPLDVHCTLYCNDEGKLDGLEPCAAWIDPETKTVMDVIHGNLILFGGNDGEGNETDLTPLVLAEVTKHLKPVFSIGPDFYLIRS